MHVEHIIATTLKQENIQEVEFSGLSTVCKNIAYRVSRGTHTVVFLVRLFCTMHYQLSGGGEETVVSDTWYHISEAQGTVLSGLSNLGYR
jgi:hypothetical protein